MQVRPEDTSGYMARTVKQMVVVVPIDAHVDEAEDIAKKYRQQRFKRGEFRAMWHLQLQNHDRYNDCDHPIAKGLGSVLLHTPQIRPVPRRGRKSIRSWR